MPNSFEKFLKICFIFIIVYWIFGGLTWNLSKKKIVLSKELEENIEKVENFELSEKIKGIKKIDGFLNKVVLKIGNDEKDEIWLFDLADESWQKINFERPVSLDSPVAMKDNYIFWLSENKEELFAFDYKEGIYYKKLVPPFNPAIGKRAEIEFLEIPWKVIFDGENFYFWSKKTGEIFPDGDSSVLEVFRKKFNLDQFLINEKLGELGFSVEINENE